MIRRATIPVRVTAEDTEPRPAPCRDCGKETEPHASNGRPLFKLWDFYMLTDETWAEAGMDGWGGFLCTPCLNARLGRALTGDDFQAVTVKATDNGLDVAARPEYVEYVLRRAAEAQERPEQ